MRHLKALLALLIVALVFIQFIRPDKNLYSAAPGPDDLLVMHPPSAAVRDTLQRACYDCHSNHTRYPWYAEIQPLAWWLDRHIRDGKEHLNFSQFGRYTPKRQLSKLDDLIGAIEDGTMPLTSYQFLHADARLSAADIDLLVAWVEDVQDQISEP
ncbi:MAG: heme-binding domain-containing protein [Opitutaceae bacterium]|nr:heme-binding domain-containing protein [Opitutaceae bacterium]